MERSPSDIQATGSFRLATREEPAPDTAATRPSPSGPPDWVEEARHAITTPGKYLAYEESGRQRMVAVSREWTRIGRSLAADVRFDDATVSRRHALIVAQADGVRVLDDRSLNGVYVNGRRVEWSPLADGDEIQVGRHSLWFVDTVTAEVPVPAHAGHEG